MSSSATPTALPETGQYKALSVLAIVACFLGLACIVILFRENAIAFVLMLAVPAIIVSIIARYRIRNSDGTLAGEALATLGLMLSVGCTVAWLTKEFTKSYITETEARNNVERWIEFVRKKKAGPTFLLSTDPEKRKRANATPDEVRKLRLRFDLGGRDGNEFDNFFADPILAGLYRYGEQTSWEFDRIVKSERPKDSIVQYWYQYRVKSPVFDGNVILLAASRDVATDDGMKREWSVRIDGDNSKRTLDMTPHGEELNDCIRMVEDTLKKLFYAIGDHEFGEVEKFVTPEFYKSANYKQILGKVRPVTHDRVIGVGIRLLFVKEENRQGDSWTIKQVMTVEPSLAPEIELEVTLHSTDPSRKKWIVQDWKFLGERKRLAESMSGDLKATESGGAPATPEIPENPLKMPRK